MAVLEWVEEEDSTSTTTCLVFIYALSYSNLATSILQSHANTNEGVQFAKEYYSSTKDQAESEIEEAH